MKRPLILTVSVALVALSLLALDDITTGNQPHFRLEWAMVAVTAAWFATLLISKLRRSR